MAAVTTTTEDICIELSVIDRLGCLRGDVRIPKASIESARVEDAPLGSLRGVRAPGIGFPGRIAVGRWRHRDGTDLVIVRKGERAVVLDLADGAPFRRVVVGVEDPERVLASVSA